jgi:hypothetical protein
MKEKPPWTTRPMRQTLNSSARTTKKTARKFIAPRKNIAAIAPRFRSGLTWLIRLRGDALAGSKDSGKSLVVDTMASWCEPCKVNLPDFASIEVIRSSGEKLDVMTTQNVQLLTLTSVVSPAAHRGVGENVATSGTHRPLPKALYTRSGVQYRESQES